MKDKIFCKFEKKEVNTQYYYCPNRFLNCEECLKLRPSYPTKYLNPTETEISGRCEKSSTEKHKRKNPTCLRGLNLNDLTMAETKVRSGNGRFAYQYCFNKDQREHLAKLLQGYDKDNVEVFIDQLERDFSLMIYGELFLGNQGDRTTHVKNLLKIKSTLDLAFKNIQNISQGRNLLLPFRKAITQDEAMDKESDWSRRQKFNYEVMSNAKALCQPYQILIEKLKSAIGIEKLNRGSRREADELRLALVIGKEFKKFIDEPKRHSGPFTSLVEYCYKIVTNKESDRKRAIRQALKKLSSS